MEQESNRLKELKMENVDLPQTLINLLDNRNEINSLNLSQELGLDHQKIIGAIKSLQTHANLVNVNTQIHKNFELLDEGKTIALNGSHEFNLLKKILEEQSRSLKNEEVLKLKHGSIGLGKALQLGWVEMKKLADNSSEVFSKVESIKDIVDTVHEDLVQLEKAKGFVDAISKDKIKEFKKRKLIHELSFKVLIVTKGTEFKIVLEKPEVDLTAEMIASGSWRNKTFKPYNFESLGVPPPSGHLHPLLKVRSEFRNIFFEMGFSEMATNRYVESSFWNFDALFQPQQHPARDMQDTFFLSEPVTSSNFPEEYLAKVKKVHSEGGYGSIGYQYDWKIEEAQKNVMRTHTTAVSARMLYHFAQESEFKPLKMFSIDRVFRNETLDATHLAEFHQVEGVIAERKLSLAHVIGLFTEFFRKCGIHHLRFKPTYNPYTEPSMEIYAFHQGLNKWVEIGNSGIFRPEMLLPMGIPEDVRVAGFGLSLERPTMIRYGISNIRELFGHKINLEMVYKNPICRLDKN